MSEGWIKLHRDLAEHWLIRDHTTLAVFIYLLLKATYTRRMVIIGGKQIWLQPGQVLAGRQMIAEHLGVTEFCVRRALTALRTGQQIRQQHLYRTSLFTITNWDEHQQERQQKRQMTAPQTYRQTATIQEVQNKEVPPLTPPGLFGAATASDEIKNKTATERPPGHAGRQPRHPAAARALPKGTNRPGIDQAQEYFSKSDYTPDEVREAWLFFEAGSLDGHWRFGHGLAGDWRAALEVRMARERRRNLPGGAYLILRQKELERCEKRLQQIRGEGTATAWGREYNPAQRDELARIKARIQQLKKELQLAV